MSHIVLVTASADLEERVHKALAEGELLSPATGAASFGPRSLCSTHLDESTAPRVVLLDAGAEPKSALELAARFDAQCPMISVVLVERRRTRDEAWLPCAPASATSASFAGRPTSQQVSPCRSRPPWIEHGGDGAEEGSRRRRGPDRPGDHRRLAQGWGRQDHGRDEPGGRTRPDAHRTRRCWSTWTCSSATSPARSGPEPEYFLADAVHGPASRTRWC